MTGEATPWDPFVTWTLAQHGTTVAAEAEVWKRASRPLVQT